MAAISAIDEARRKLDAARAELARLRTTQADQAAREKILQSERQAVEVGRGERVLSALLAGDGAAAVAEESSKVGATQIELETVGDVLSALLAHVASAERQVITCKCGCLAIEAAALERQADGRQAKSAELMKALCDFEQCEYVPRAALNLWVEQFAPPTRGPFDVPAPVPAPLTGRLIQQAAYFRATAERWRQGDRAEVNPLTGETLYPLPPYLGTGLDAGE